MYYCYTTILGKSEKEFWEATPAKIFKQIEVHSEFINKKNIRSNSNNNSHEIKGEEVRLKVLD